MELQNSQRNNKFIQTSTTIPKFTKTTFNWYVYFTTVRCDNQCSTDNWIEDDQVGWDHFLLWCVVLLSPVLLLLLFPSRSWSLFTIFTFFWMEIVFSVYDSVFFPHLPRIESWVVLVFDFFLFFFLLFSYSIDRLIRIPLSDFQCLSGEQWLLHTSFNL